MADTRARPGVKLVDPTTNANEARVTAGGNVGVDIGASITLTVDTELAAAAALADNFANPTTAAVGAFGMLWDGATWDRAPGNSAGGQFTQGPAAHDATLAGNPVIAGGRSSAAAPTDVSADGEAVWAWHLRNGAAATVLTAAGALIGGDATNGLDVDVTRVQGTVTVDSELEAAAALADATANPTSTRIASYLMGFNGTTWDRVRVANTGRLQVDVVSGGGTSTPTNPVISYQTSASLAAGASIALTTAAADNKKLRAVTVWASVPFKAVLVTHDNGADSTTNKVTGGGTALQTWDWRTPHQNYFVLGSTAGLDAFRVNVTNLDNAAAADVYATFLYED